MIEDAPDTTNTDNWPYAERGLRWILEGFYMWLAPRLPNELIFRATSVLLEYADEKGLETYDILEAQSLWMQDKLAPPPACESKD